MHRYTVGFHEINESMSAGEDIYILSEGKQILLAKEGSPFDANILRLLRLHKLESIRILSPDPPPKPKGPPPSHIYGTDAPEFLPNTKIKVLISNELREAAVENIRELFVFTNENRNKPVNLTTAFKILQGVDNIVERLISTVANEDLDFIHIADLKKYDEYTYHHSLSVAVLSIATGESLSLSDYDLKKLGRAAIMHDIGKTIIPLEILNKPGKLTDEEFDIIKNHARGGGMLLRQRGIGDLELWNAVSCHHEKFAGNGYPAKLEGRKIPLFSRIIAVSDVYDAVTSFRPYRKPMTPSEVYDLIMSEVDRAFDYDIVKAFIKKLKPYPLNTIVEITGNRVGIVVNNLHELRPILRMNDTHELIDLAVSPNLSTMITRVFNQSEMEGQSE